MLIKQGGANSNFIRFASGVLDIRTGTATISGSAVNINTPKFFLGSSSQFVSGSNGNIEISSSNFHLDNQGNVDMTGTITANTGEIGGFVIGTTSLTGLTSGTEKFRLETGTGDGLLIDDNPSFGLSLGGDASSDYNADSGTSIPIVMATQQNATRTIFRVGDATNFLRFDTAGTFTLQNSGTTTISGSAVNIQTPKFFLGGGGQFVSGSNGNIEVSSSRFHLKPDGNVVVTGEINADSGDIGGFALENDKIINKTVSGTSQTTSSLHSGVLAGYENITKNTATDRKMTRSIFSAAGAKNTEIWEYRADDTLSSNHEFKTTVTAGQFSPPGQTWEWAHKDPYDDLEALFESITIQNTSGSFNSTDRGLKLKYNTGIGGSLQEKLVIGCIDRKNVNHLAPGGLAPVYYGISGSNDFTASFGRIISSQTVGIGTNSPDKPLHISSADNQPLRVESTDAYSGIEIKDNGSSTLPPLISALSDDFIIYGGHSSARPAVMSIKSAGNVGIGTTSPVAPLHISTTANAITSTSVDVSNLQFKILNPANDNDEAVGMGFALSTDDENIGAAIIHNRQGSESYGSLHFATKASGDAGGADIPIKMSLSPDGNLGIGTTNPQSMLHISDATNSNLEIDGASAGVITIQSLNDARNAYENIKIYGDKINLQANTSGEVGIGVDSPVTAFDVHSHGTEIPAAFGMADDGNALIATRVGEVEGRISGHAFMVGTAAIDGYSSTNTTATITSKVTNSGTLAGNLKFAVNSGDSLNTVMTIESSSVYVEQLAQDDHIMEFRSTGDVAHGFTAKVPTTTFGAFKKCSATAGGLMVRGFREAVTGHSALRLEGSLNENADTGKNGSSYGVIRMEAHQQNGSNSHANIDVNGNILSIGTNGTTEFIFDKEGQIHLDASTAQINAFDSYDDAMLVRAMSTTTAPKEIIHSEFDKYVKYNEKTLIEAGLLGKVSEEDKKKGVRPLVNSTGLQKLHNGAIWQQYSEMQQMKQLMYETMVETIGKEAADKKLEKHGLKLLNQNKD